MYPEEIRKTIPYVAVKSKINHTMLYMENYKIISLTGPSGAGKTTIAQALFRQYPQLVMIPSLTSRQRRESDLPGDFVYVSREEFSKRKEAGELLWDVEAHGTLYGTAKAAIDEALARRHPSLIILVPEIVKFLFDRYPDRYLPIFIEPPPEEILRARLVLRGESEETINRRLSDCRDWSAQAHASSLPYRFVHNHGPIEETVQEIAHILRLATGH